MNLLKGDKSYFDKEGVELTAEDLNRLRSARLREHQAVLTAVAALLVLLGAMLAGASVLDAALRGGLAALLGTWPIRWTLQMFWWGIEVRETEEPQVEDE